MAWAAFNGIGLALVLPCAQSVIADYYRPELRGRAFGFMFTMAALGLCPSTSSLIYQVEILAEAVVLEQHLCSQSRALPYTW